MSCIFCDLAQETKAKIWESDTVYAINDINPQAPTHILVISKSHRSCFHETELEQLQAMMSAAQEIVSLKGLSEKGYRLVINTGEYGGQTVPHVHLHILAGAKLSAEFN
ncbi:MAG: HIT domain-containing protein [Brevinema sp.]